MQSIKNRLLWLHVGNLYSEEINKNICVPLNTYFLWLENISSVST